MADRIPELSTSPTNKGAISITRTDSVEYSYMTLYRHYVSVRVPLGYSLDHYECQVMAQDGSITTQIYSPDTDHFNWHDYKPPSQGSWGVMSVVAVFTRVFRHNILRNSQGVILRGANGKIVRDA